jgi:hypothetical protein
MYVQKIEWITKEYDLHVIPGYETEHSLLKIHFDNGTVKWPSEILPSDNVTVKFDWRISIRPGGGAIHAWGMGINLDTGWLKIDDHLDPPSHRLYNSIVEVTVIDNNTDSPNPITSAIRIHVYESIKSAWLTPSALSVHEGTDSLRFSILAEFNNHDLGVDRSVIGDISYHPGIEWESGDPNFVEVDQHNGYLKARLGTSSVSIRAKLPPPFSVVAPRGGTVFPEKSWSLLPANVKPVGEPSISQSRIDKFPNVLFIPDGFKEEEEELFKKLVIDIFHQIITSPSLMPYGLFTVWDKINYWYAFIPSPEWGTSVLHLMSNLVVDLDGTGTFYSNIDYKNPPYANKPHIQSTGMWNLQELIYVVGLPIEFDQLRTDDLQNYENKLQNWIDRFNHDDIILHIDGESEKDTWKRKVDIKLWKKWKNLGHYLLANEKDTALGIVRGNRPRVNDDRTLGLHPFRTKREHLDKFLMNLKAPGIQTPIGKIWATTDSNGLVDKGKDSKYVVVLCRGTPRGGSQDPSTDLIYESIKDSDDVHLDLKSNLVETEIVPEKVPDLDLKKSISHLMACQTVHELSHGFGLGDEFGEGEKESMPDTQSFKDRLKLIGNLQLRSELLIPFSNKISSFNIKWKWHRIETAGILVQNPIQPSPQVFVYHIKLEPGQAQKFHNGDRVFLRQRPLIKNPAAITSPELEVNADPEGDIVVVKMLAEALNIADFPGGTANPLHDSILFRPRPGTIGTPFELIVHNKILDLITISGGPLNAPSGQPMRDCVTDIRNQVPRLIGNEIQTPKFPQTFQLSKPIANQDQILGLYEGGRRYHCNIYHPGGNCQMRSSDDATSYCHVCRYILADILDPSAHGIIDALYDDTYSKI